VWEAVTFPDAETLTAIDAVLAERPERPGHVIPHRFYSWTPDETIEDLEIENLKIAAAPQRAPRRRR
jgi:hypothetical protein